MTSDLQTLLELSANKVYFYEAYEGFKTVESLKQHYIFKSQKCEGRLSTTHFVKSGGHGYSICHNFCFNMQVYKAKPVATMKMTNDGFEERAKARKEEKLKTLAEKRTTEEE
ncbi:RNA helicase [Sarracenia purpurea var. burkii]